jgi:hypothetical protein
VRYDALPRTVRPGNSRAGRGVPFADHHVPGDAPRYFSNLRGDGIQNIDLSFTKEFTIKERRSLQLRGELFNFTITERFAFPDVGVGSATFGDVTSSAPAWQGLRLKAEIEVKGQRHAVRWACHQRLNGDGSLTLRPTAGLNVSDTTGGV